MYYSRPETFDLKKVSVMVRLFVVAMDTHSMQAFHWTQAAAENGHQEAMGR